MSLLEKHKGKILLSLLLAVVVYAVLLLVSDTGKLVTQVSNFQWELLPIIIGLTLFNYALRFVKWHYFLHVVGVDNLYWFDSLVIFLAGFSMTLTPGKAGEFLKAFLVRQRAGAPVAVTSPIVLSERLTDGLALLILAAAGLLIFDSLQVRLVMVIVIVGAVLLVLIVQRRELANGIFVRMERVSFLSARMHSIQAFYDSSYALLQFKTLGAGIALGIVSWAGECFALGLILVGFGIPFSWTLVALSAFAQGFSTLAGGLLLVPGGLGVSEASIDGLLLAFGRAPWLPEGTITQPISAAATVIIRFATLWFGFLLGLVCLAIVQRRFAGQKELIPDSGI